MLGWCFVAHLFFMALAGSPQFINYQAVVRTNNGQVVADNTPVTFRFTIHNIQPNGSVLFTEVQNTSTGSLGLVALKIGTTSDLSVVPWANGDKYLQVEMDINNSGTFVDMGTSQMSSVPYALYAASTNIDVNALWSTNGNRNMAGLGAFLGSTDSSSLLIQPLAGNVGIGNNTPTHKLQLDGSFSQRFVGDDGILYELSANDTINSIGQDFYPHVAMMAGPASGLHSIVSLENINYKSNGSPYFAVFGVIDNSGPLKYAITADTTYIRITASTSQGERSRYSFSHNGVYFSNENNGTGYFQTSMGGQPGYNLTLDATGDTATWQPSAYTVSDSVSIYNTAPAVGSSYFCHNCSGNNIPGRVVVFTPAGWRRLAYED